MALACGPTKYSRGGFIEFARYESGEIAMFVNGPEGPEFKPTVSLVPYGAEDPGEDGVWLKDWSENEGAVKALVASGIIELTDRTHPIGHVIAKHGRLTQAAMWSVPVHRRTMLGRCGMA